VIYLYIQKDTPKKKTWQGWQISAGEAGACFVEKGSTLGLNKGSTASSVKSDIVHRKNAGTLNNQPHINLYNGYLLGISFFKGLLGGLNS